MTKRSLSTSQCMNKELKKVNRGNNVAVEHPKSFVEKSNRHASKSMLTRRSFPVPTISHHTMLDALSWGWALLE